MSRYTPSLSRNNDLKEKFGKSFNALLYKVEKGRLHSHLDPASVKPFIDDLKAASERFEGAVGTGKENIIDLYDNAVGALHNLEKSFNQELTSQVEEASDELIFVVESWIDVLNGNVEFDTEGFKKAKASWTKKRIVKRLNELDEIKTGFSENEKRLETEIIQLEKESSELDEIMLNEDNERRLNELYRKITTIKSKVDSLNIRRSNYSACFNLLDLVYANAKEIVAAYNYSNSDLGNAKAFLNLGKLKQVLDEPEKAVSILKQMEKDIKKIAEKTKKIDISILNIDGQNTSVSSEALMYKENLMRKKKEQEALKTVLDAESENITADKTIKGDL